MGAWTVTVPATETSAGTQERRCTNTGCTYIETEAIPMLAHTHVPGAWEVTKAATCTVPGEKVQKCTSCGAVIATEPVAATGVHTWSEWAATPASTKTAIKEERVCTGCGITQQRSMTIPATSLKMQKSQKTTKFTVTGLAEGDSVVSWTSGNNKLFTVSGKANGTCTLKALKKTGTAYLTITLASGLEQKVKVKVQKAKVTTTSVKLTSKKITVKKSKKLSLKPLISPVTTQDTVTYTSADKKIATVTKSGVVKGIKAGKTKITIKAGKKKAVCTVTVK